VAVLVVIVVPVASPEIAAVPVNVVFPVTDKAPPTETSPVVVTLDGEMAVPLTLPPDSKMPLLDDPGT
jgi:hypothetical protein